MRERAFRQRRAQVARTAIYGGLPRKKWSDPRFRIEAILLGDMEPYDDGQRLSVEGPDVFVPSEAVVPLTMALHELDTRKNPFLGLGADGLRWSWAG